MMLNDHPTYYETLEIGSDASPQDIREAYLRLKNAYGRDSLALYSLMDKEETARQLQEIEIAYQILSHPEKRREYDANHGLKKIVSIDRVPPMETETPEEEILVAPKTDFKIADFKTEEPKATFSPPRDEPAVTIPQPALDDIERRIAAENEWHGAFLREVRENRGISLEELAEFTKISKTYLRAIESEEFGKLPVVVYVRGFLSQIARKLRLPQDKFVKAYMTRFREKAPEKC